MLAIIILCTCSKLVAQYSEDAFDLKKASDLYDERGYMQGAAISVDGKLAVTESNGNLSYIYPLADFSVKGVQFNVTLSYSGSVAFTAFNRHTIGRDAPDFYPVAPYAGWSRFQQNRPAWIVGVNGWAIQMLSTTSHFHIEHGTRIENHNHLQYNDSDFIWVADGYDFCNRMVDFGADASTEALGTTYVDHIRLLRADGSVLDLVNANPVGLGQPDTRPELYTGHYIATEANSSGFGLVEFDSSRWTTFMRNAIVTTASEGERYPLIPRVLRYYPGDGLEYIFREWIIPYGMQPYTWYDSAAGGKYAGPTIFYLEEIKGPNGTITGFLRQRHYPVNLTFMTNVTADSTRGRAAIWTFAGQVFSFGSNWMTVQAAGRTTMVKFAKVQPSGRAGERASMPIASNGYLVDWSRDLANAAETDPILYRSYLGYVTEIIDPEGRKTTFEYEPYVRKYMNFGFPHGNSGVTMKLENLRLKEVKEPTARYRVSYFKKAPDISYHPAITEYQYVSDASDTLTANAQLGPLDDIAVLSNVTAAIKKYDLNNTLLTTNRYRFEYEENTTFADRSIHTQIDEVTHDTTMTELFYRRILLPSLGPWRPEPRYTALWKTITSGAGVVTTTTTYHSASDGTTTYSGWGSSYTGAASSTGTPYLIVDTAQKVTVNGVLKAYTRSTFTLDTIRTFGGDDVKAGLFGQEITGRTAHIIRPDDGTIHLSRITEYRHLPLVDTTRTVITKFYQKLIMMQRWDSLLRNNLIDPALSWEQVTDDPRIVSVVYDTSQARLRLAPHYALETRTLVKDSAGTILAGRGAAYHTAYDPADQLSYHEYGLLRTDSVIGHGGTVWLPARHYGYAGRLPAEMINEHGALSRSSYDYTFPGATDQSSIERTRAGVIMDNLDDTTSYRLRGAVYGNITEEPLATRQYVRKYTPTLSIDTIALSSASERTFYGQINGAIDANGWYTRSDYDRNGRLRTLWMPYDFQGTDSVITQDITGWDSTDSYGSTQYSVRFTNVVCHIDHPGDPDSIAQVYRWGEFYADKPVIVVPTCPPCNESEKERDPSILATCRDPLPYVDQTPATGTAMFRVVPVGATSILQLDSVYLRLYISSVIGTCVNFKVSVPTLNISKTFVLNCDQMNGGGGGGGNGSETNLKDRSPGILTGSDSGGYFLMLDLTSAKTTLQGYTPNQLVAAGIEVTTSGSRVECVSGFDAGDLRPRLMLKGTFRKQYSLADYTLRYTYDDAGLASTISAKVDDARHTANRLDTAALQYDSRRTQVVHRFGADGRVIRKEAAIVEDHGATRIDTTSFAHNGLGLVVKTTDAELDTAGVRYDALGRAVKGFNADGTSTTTTYKLGTPASFGPDLSDQDFHGFCSATISVDEHGNKHVKYLDAFDQLRRDVADSGGSHHITRYEYDPQGRLTTVINPKGDTTRYWYDDFGRVKKKQHPDLNIVSYTHDFVGNIRFTQSQEQAQRNRLTFHQYDDLNRLVLVGVANFALAHNEDSIDVQHAQPGTFGTKGSSAGILSDPNEPETWRLTDLLKGTYLHTAVPTLLTSNKTLWMSPVRAVPQLTQTFNLRYCVMQPLQLLGETEAPSQPQIMRPAQFYNAGWSPVADTSDFEHLAQYPEFPRMAIMYDSLPEPAGPVWGGFPADWQWDQLAPKGRVRNLRGREAAVAYRERGAEPYHFSVTSYDERGRVEALLRFTENLGFDAVYYTYNSMNQVTSVRVADYVRQHTTWYGYDAGGRIDSVWTSLSGDGSGLYSSFFGTRYPVPADRPDTADIVYRYTKAGQIDSMFYPPVNVLVDYAYNHRKWLDSLVATQNGAHIFREILRYDARGQITEQQWKHGAGARMSQKYEYDSLRRLTEWTHGQANSTLPSDVTNYMYDNIGNRTNTAYLPAIGGSAGESYSYPTDANRLVNIARTEPGGVRTTRYWYNWNGSAIRETESFNNMQTVSPVAMQDYGWSYRELMRRVVTYNAATGQKTEDWRYRPNPMGEREQKRVYSLTKGDDSVVYPWVYYLLGGNRSQLAVYHGQQVSKTWCGGTGRRVYMYPVEFLTYGVGGNANVVTYPTGMKEFRVADHIGSARVMINIGGGIVGEYDYKAFGESIAVTPAVAGLRKSFIDKEQDRENGDYDLGVRHFSSGSGRFLTIDPLWENFRSSSPYGYSLNNPIVLTDRNGFTVDVYHLAANDASGNTEHLQRTIDDLKKKTGLELYYNSESGLLLYDASKTQENVGSPTLRNLLMDAISSEIKVTFFPISPDDADQNSRAHVGGNMAYLNFGDIERSIEGTVGADKTTFGYGFSFMHEMLHTAVGPDGGLEDIGLIGPVEERLNEARVELGPEYGQRLRYNGALRFENNQKYSYIPFSHQAVYMLNNNGTPQPGISGVRYVRRLLNE